MPRIDPVQLLKCLSVLLSKNGGVKSKDEVQRLASLMNKFSKKLVSKCIYIHILKNTETDLLGLFMGAGGWTLTFGWLTDGILAHNWPLVQELIELLLVCPVNVERLKSNNCPKLVKNLSKDATDQVLRTLALTLVEQWLLIVKSAPDEAPSPLTLNQVQDIRNSVETTIEEVLDLGTVEQSVDVGESDESEDPQENNFEFVSVEPETVSKNQSVSPVVEEKTKQNEALPILKISVKDGKQVISKVKTDEISKVNSDETSTSKKSDEIKIKEERTKDKSKERRKDGGSSSGSNSSSKHSSSSKSVSSKSIKSSSSRDRSLDRSKDRDRSKSSKSGSSTKDSKHSDRHKDKEPRHKDRDKRSSGSDKSKEKSKNQSEKNKETLEKLQPASLSKLGKIPKKTTTSVTDKQEPKKEKPSISIEVRKPSDANRPKTVKMFNSKFRSHGLEEEAKRPPPRGLVLNKPPAVAPAPQPLKRSSPPRQLETPPEKKPKMNEHIDKPGAIKLIPPKPKPAALLESDMFVHAITASATTKKDPKKRKRRTSASKDERSGGDSSPPATPTDSMESPKIPASAAPPRFYQDTLEPEEDKKPDIIPEDDIKIDPEILVKIEEMDTTDIKSPDSPKRSPSGLKGVLIHLKRRGPKKSLRWKPEEELEEIQYFELDENERTNVTRTFTDMMHLEKSGEREANRKSRNLHNDDLMEEKIAWRPLILISGVPHIAYGNKSKEKDIQAAREKSILPALRFHQSVPDSAFEPDAESHPTTDPVVIPLEDVTGSTDNINDFRSTPWPEPKQTPAPVGPGGPGAPMLGPPMFPAMAPFPPGFPQNPPFGMPGFPPNPAMMNPADWQNGPPAMMMPPDAMSMPPDMFPPNQMFPPNGFPMMDGMTPPMFPGRFPGPGMPAPGVPNGPPGQFNANNLNLNGNNRGGVRNMGPRGGQNPMWRSKGPRQWNNNNGPSRGGGPLRNTVCNFFQNKGYCRTGDKCQFRHPGVNCPF